MIRNNRTKTALVIGSVLVCEILIHVLFYLMGPYPLFKDALGYWKMGISFSQGDWLVLNYPIAYRTPGYPIFLGVVQHFFETNALQVVIFFQHVVSLLTNILAVTFVWRRTKSILAVTVVYAFLFLCFSSYAIANRVLAETFYEFFLLLVVLLVDRFVSSPNRKLAIVIGLLLGFILLVRPIGMFLFLPIGAILLWCFTSRYPIKQSIRLFITYISIILVIAVLSSMPWQIRNEIVFGEAFLTKITGRSAWNAAFIPYGRNLDFVESPETQKLFSLTGLNEKSPDARHNWTVSGRLHHQFTGLSEVEVDDLMLSVVMASIKAQMFEFLIKTPKQIAVFWAGRSFDIDPPNIQEKGSYLNQKISIDADISKSYLTHRFPAPTQFRYYNGIVFMLSIFGLVIGFLNKKTRYVSVLIVLIFAYHAVLSSVLGFPTYRYRMVLEPLIAISLGFLVLGQIRLGKRSIV